MIRKFKALKRNNPRFASFSDWAAVIVFGLSVGVFWNQMIAWSYP